MVRSPAGALVFLVALVEAYKLPPSDPIDALAYFLASRGCTLNNLGLSNGESDISEISSKRPLTITMTRNLERTTGIPTSIFTQPFATAWKRSARRFTHRLRRR